MLEVHSDLLWIANAMEARDPQKLFELGIVGVVDLAYEEPPATLPRSLAYLRVPLLDAADNDEGLVNLALGATTELLLQGSRTVVACSAGLSRSPTIASFAVARAFGEMNPNEVIDRIASAKLLDVSGAFFKQVEMINAKHPRP